MSFCTKKVCALALAGLMFFSASLVQSWRPEGEPIGSITAINGEVWLAHRGDKVSYPAMPGDSVYPYDHIQTEKWGRLQILFEDESLLNLAGNTYIQIMEYVYSPQENKRSVVIRVVMGRVRGVVGRYFGAPSSRYIIETPADIIEIEHAHFVVDAAAGRIQ